MILLALNTGMRRGEIFGIEWRDADLDRAMLTVRGEITKNDRTRHIPLNATALSVLRDWQKQTSNEGIVFNSRKGTRFTNITNAWQNLLKDAVRMNRDIKDNKYKYKYEYNKTKKKVNRATDNARDLADGTYVDKKLDRMENSASRKLKRAKNRLDPRKEMRRDIKQRKRKAIDNWLAD